MTLAFAGSDGSTVFGGDLVRFDEVLNELESFFMQKCKIFADLSFVRITALTHQIFNPSQVK